LDARPRLRPRAGAAHERPKPRFEFFVFQGL